MGVAAAAWISTAQAAESYIVLESHSGKVLFADNSEVKRPVASLTKVATAKVALDWAAASKTDLNTAMVVPYSASAVQGANPLGLKPGDSLTVRNALYSALLGSDNIAAQTLADHVGRELLKRRQVVADPVETFVAEMNKLATSLGMARTKFRNPHGLDGKFFKGTSTASDMARLAMFVMKDDAFAFYVKQKTRNIKVTRADGSQQEFDITNTNKILGKDGIVGVKTGMTQAAGQCLMTAVARKPIVIKKPQENAEDKVLLYPRQLVVVLLGSNDRFVRTEKLIKQGWAAYDKWYEAGFPVSQDGREFLKLPK